MTAVTAGQARTRQAPASEPGAAAAQAAAGGVAATYHARQMLARAHWAADAFASYDRESVLRIAGAVAGAAHARARKYAEWAVSETGFGVVEHKIVKNEACSSGIFERYRDEDYVSPRADPDSKIVSLPRPAGVVLALTPSTNPVCSVFFKIIIALLTRNAIVISPHPMARECCTDAAATLAGIAVEAGAPDGIIQIVANATVPLIEALMADPVTDVIVATGGTPVVRAAHRSGNPALGVGPGNVPVLVDATADLPAAARRITASKAFDNSVLCTSESVLIAQESIADRLLKELRQQHAAVLGEQDTARLRGYLFPDGRLNATAIGKDATWIAAQAGVRVPPQAKVLVTPIERVADEELLAHEKLSPVLALVKADTAARGIEAARAVVRLGGAGHSAAIHSRDPGTILRFGARVPVLRVSVNVGNSTGSSGLETGLAPSMTLGTGFVGRSSIGENLEPRHLVNWTRIAYNSSADVPFDDFAGIGVTAAPGGPVPRYPHASNLPAAGAGGTWASGTWAAGSGSGPAGAAPTGDEGRDPPPGYAAALAARADTDDGEIPEAVREQLRALIVEELRALVR
ncbi:MAG TPA: aldehyde dehydrogenase family protein [Streptosporangiaceae bacterium]